MDGINQTFHRLGADFFLQLRQNFRFMTAVHSATGNLQKKEQTDNVLIKVFSVNHSLNKD